MFNSTVDSALRAFVSKGAPLGNQNAAGPHGPRTAGGGNTSTKDVAASIQAALSAHKNASGRRTSRYTTTESDGAGGFQIQTEHDRPSEASAAGKVAHAKLVGFGYAFVNSKPGEYEGKSYNYKHGNGKTAQIVVASDVVQTFLSKAST